MSYSVGMIIGGIIGLYLLTTLIHWAVVKRIIAEPGQATIVSLVAGYLAAGILSGFGGADGGPFVWEGFVTYGIAAVAVVPLKLWELKRQQAKASSAQAETFG